MRKSNIRLAGVLLIICTAVLFSACAAKVPVSSTPVQSTPKETPIESPKPSQPVFPKTVAVDIRDFRFDPDELVINRGDAVSWTNQDGAAHTILINGGVESPALREFDVWNNTFTQPGTYHYRCGIHPSMVGTIVVQ
ncbi:cupredoxin domain-containing protein [Candidatus Woesearchaeota archaeon]|nr:cupredoxin domain-containing protein [Candidatus Woesearchaeota archaeon]